MRRDPEKKNDKNPSTKKYIFKHYVDETFESMGKIAAKEGSFHEIR